MSLIDRSCQERVSRGVLGEVAFCIRSRGFLDCNVNKKILLEVREASMKGVGFGLVGNRIWEQVRLSLGVRRFL